MFHCRQWSFLVNAVQRLNKIEMEDHRIGIIEALDLDRQCQRNVRDRRDREC